MKMTKLFAVGVLLSGHFLSFSLYAAAETETMTITAEQWAIPRHGERILKMPEMIRVMQKMQQHTQATIEISYPGGENGELWLTELKDWLIALGVSSANIKSIAASGSKDIIKLSVIAAGGVSE
ncbi:MAG: hypothetical protein OEY29_05775 [Gammaproteobacteria bacterium]|nr:hypothetical protein [Gammaproteobacteria bacterium]